MASRHGFECVMKQFVFPLTATRKEKAKILSREKNRIRKATARAITGGILVRPDCCSDCKTPCKPEGHHPDYGQHLLVEWLCNTCHWKRHKRYSNPESRYRTLSIAVNDDELKKINRAVKRAAQTKNEWMRDKVTKGL